MNRIRQVRSYDELSTKEEEMTVLKDWLLSILDTKHTTRERNKVKTAIESVVSYLDALHYAMNKRGDGEEETVTETEEMKTVQKTN